MSFESFFEDHLRGVRWGKNRKGMALCPFHDDKRKSLSIEANNGLWFCHACCIGGTISDLAKRLGVSDPKREKTSPVACYIYTDEKGAPIFRVLRGEDKKFWVERYLGDGQWEKGMGNVKAVPYKLHKILSANDMIFITEGEKDVETLISLGFTTTTNPFGAGKWSPNFNQYFKQRDVVLIPDNDPPGLSHMEEIAKNLYPVANSVKLIPLPGLKEKEDVTDWISSGHGEEELLELTNESQYQWPPMRDEEQRNIEKAGEPGQKDKSISDKKILPEFPNETWVGISKDYYALFGPSTEAPEAYHFGSVMTILGLLLGRKFYILHPRRIHLNYYFLIIGESGFSRKGTAIGYGMDICEAMNEKIKFVKAFVSMEGVYQAMKEEGTRLLVFNDELRTLFANAHRQGTQNILSGLCTFYDLPKNFIIGQKDLIEIKNGLLSMISAITPESMSQREEIEAATGGFLARNILLAGELKYPIANPVEPEDSQRNKFIKDLMKWRKALPEDGGQIIKGKTAIEFYTDYYNSWWKEMRESPIAMRLLKNREALHVIKLSGLFALQNERMEIQREDVERAIKVIGHSSKCQSIIFRNITLSPKTRLQVRLKEFLESGPKNRREINRGPGRSCDAEEVTRALRALKDSQEVETEEKRNLHGEHSTIYRLSQEI